MFSGCHVTSNTQHLSIPFWNNFFINSSGTCTTDKKCFPQYHFWSKRTQKCIQQWIQAPNRLKSNIPTNSYFKKRRRILAWQGRKSVKNLLQSWYFIGLFRLQKLIYTKYSCITVEDLLHNLISLALYMLFLKSDLQCYFVGDLSLATTNWKIHS